jgi:transcriptional regulator with XRE-family HTH domain
MSGKFKALRLAAGFTQKQMADLLGVNQSQICGWESGRFAPRATRIPMIARVLGRDVSEVVNALLEDEEA